MSGIPQTGRECSPRCACYVSVAPLFRRILRSVRHPDKVHFDITLAVDAQREVGADELGTWRPQNCELVERTLDVGRIAELWAQVAGS